MTDKFNSGLWRRFQIKKEEKGPVVKYINTYICKTSGHATLKYIADVERGIKINCTEDDVRGNHQGISAVQCNQ